MPCNVLREGDCSLSAVSALRRTLGRAGVVEPIPTAKPIMDDQSFRDGCQLMQEGRLPEAFHLFSKLAEDTEDRIDKAAAILHAAKVLKLLERHDEAAVQLSVARALVAEYFPLRSPLDERLVHLEIYFDYEDADLSWKQGKKEQALAKFEDALQRHKEKLRESAFIGFYELMQTCRAFLLVDLGRWREAMPILEKAGEYTEYKEGIAFYLGHCYVSAQEHAKAKPKLIEALRLGLPPQLEYRAHDALGLAYFALGGYAQAKMEFEKTLETANSAYLKGSEIWKMLEISCRQLGLKEEAERYARLAELS
jgi:tetratricopeptide (TPR) repeat protein